MCVMSFHLTGNYLISLWIFHMASPRVFPEKESTVSALGTIQDGGLVTKRLKESSSKISLQAINCRKCM